MLPLLEQEPFQTGTNACLDEGIFAMCQVKNQPLIYCATPPSLCLFDDLSEVGALGGSGMAVPQLSVEQPSRAASLPVEAAL